MLPCPRRESLKQGCFHCAKYSGNFGRKSKGKVRFGSVRPKSTSGGGFFLLLGLVGQKFAVPFFQTYFSLLYITYVGNSRKEGKNGKSHSSWSENVFSFPSGSSMALRPVGLA